MCTENVRCAFSKQIWGPWYADSRKSLFPVPLAGSGRRVAKRQEVEAGLQTTYLPLRDDHDDIYLNSARARIYSRRTEGEEVTRGAGRERVEGRLAGGAAR